MKGDAGRSKPDRRRRAVGDDSTEVADTEAADTDASGWLAAQFQEPGDTDAQAQDRAPADPYGRGREQDPGGGHPAAEPRAWRDPGRPPDAPDVIAPPIAPGAGPATASRAAPLTAPGATPDALLTGAPAALAGGFRWGLTSQETPATPPPVVPASEPPVRRASDPAAHPAAASPSDPFLPADPHLPIVPPDLPVAAASDVSLVAPAPVASGPVDSAPVPTAARHDSFVVPPPDRVLPTELYSPVQAGEPTEPLVSRRTFQPRESADPDLPATAPGPVQLSPAPVPPLTPSFTHGTAHRENDDSPLAALFRERERHLPETELIAQRPSVPPFGVSSASASSVAAPYPGAPLPSPPLRRDVAADSGRTSTPGSGLSGNKKLLLWGGGAILAVLALIALFFLGTKLPELFGSAPAAASASHGASAVASVSPSPSASATPSPSPSAPPVTAVAAVGPLAPGTYSWEELRGGECLAGYESPWAEEFTVVDCAAPHPAQLVHRGVFGPDDASAYPGIDALQAQINLLCSAPTVIDFAAAGAYSDIRFAGSFAATDKEWVAGHRDYFCFVSRSSGEPLTGSVAVPVS